MSSIKEALLKNYPLYFIEAGGLGVFMLSACLFTILFEHPDLGLTNAIPSPFLRRTCIGCAMGLTAIAIIYSPWGRKSGAQINPSVTLTMLFLKKITWPDAIFYMLFQTIGGVLAVSFLKMVIPSYLSAPFVNYVVTIPGENGLTAAFAGECIISFILMSATLLSSNSDKWHHFTGIISGILILLFVAFEAPFSGFSMNPARTIASALPSGIWTAWWIYFIGPPLSMVSAAVIYRLLLSKNKTHGIRHYFATEN